MLTLVLQNCVALLDLGFAAAALAAARRGDPRRDPRDAGWLLLGLVFALVTAVVAVQDAWATRAFLAGPGAPVYQAYLRWAPVANHSRGGLTLAFGLLLLALVWRRRVGRGFWRATAAALALGLAAGAWLGWREGALREATHYSAIAVFGAAEMAVVLAALVVALAGSALDRLLWLCLAVYGVFQSLNVLWFSGLAWLGVRGVWTPAPWQLQGFRVVEMLLMLALARRRWTLARRGVAVPALLEAPREALPVLR